MLVSEAYRRFFVPNSADDTGPGLLELCENVIGICTQTHCIYFRSYKFYYDNITILTFTSNISIVFNSELSNVVFPQAMHPSQVRYVRYFNRLIRERFVYAPNPLMLLAVEFSECPAHNGFLCSTYLSLVLNLIRSSLFHQTGSKQQTVMTKLI